MGNLTIGRLGRETSTKVETIRYYEKIGLLPEPRRTAANYRVYTDAHLNLLGFIRRARELGFSIEVIRDLLRLAAHGEAPCDDIDRIAAQHLETTEKKIALLMQLRRELRDTLESCKGGRVAECKVMVALSPERSGGQTGA